MADEDTDTKPKRPPALAANALRAAPLERADLFCTVPIGTTYEQVMTPAFWQNHIRTLAARPWARVEVVSEDGALDLTLRCLKASPGMAVMRCLSRYDSPSARAKSKAAPAEDGKLELPPGYKWAHVPNGENKGHMIRLDNATGDVIVRGELTKDAAVAKAIAHYNAASAAPAQ